MSGDLRASTYAAFDEGVKAMESRDYQAAVQHFSVAIETGGLNADTYTEARICRAICLASTKQFSKAHADLDEIEPYAGNVEDVYAARALVLRLEGKKAAADQAVAKARKINPQVRKFDEFARPKVGSPATSEH